MPRRARRWDDPLRPQFNATFDSPAAVKTWRDSEYNAGHPSGVLDYYRAHAVCIACRGCGLHPSPAVSDRREPLFTPCKLCRGSGEVPVL